MSCDMEKTLFLAVCKADVEETGTDEAVEKDIVEIWKRAFSHGNAESLDRNYYALELTPRQKGRRVKKAHYS